MSNNPFNLAFRFLLELAGLAAFAYWGWQTGAGWLGWLLAIAAPLLAAVIWGVFRLPDDPGRAPVAVSGRVRLAILGLFQAEAQLAGLVFAAALLVHYALSYNRLELIPIHTTQSARGRRNSVFKMNFPPNEVLLIAREAFQ
jgi:hypothetical protein